jgi:hypothetical protein
MKSKSILSGMALAAMLTASPAFAAGEHEGPVKDFVAKNVMSWLGSAEIVDAVKAQNAKNASLGQGDIDKLDKQWRAEVDASAKPLIDATLGNALSKFLMAKKAENPEVITEMFVMDDKGLNVGQSDVTSDYWQGDEAKWQKTFSMGPDAVFVDEIEKDESTQALQSQISVTIKDSSGAAVGAITIGLNVEKL